LLIVMVSLRFLRASLLSLLHKPTFTLLAILTLGIGIGATVALFSVVYGVLLRPLPFARSGEIVSVWLSFPGINSDRVPLSDAVYRFYKARSRSLEALGLYLNDEVNLTGGSEPERVWICDATASVFSVLGVPPTLGRTLVEEDEKPGAEPVAVISHDLWQRVLGADPAAVGRTLRIDGLPRRIVGVMPKGFAFPRPQTAVWMPVTIDPARLTPDDFSYIGIGRLRSGATAEKAAHELSTLAQQLPEAIGGPFTRSSLQTWKLRALVRDLLADRVADVKRTLWTLLIGAGLILLIACANVANLILVRAEGRRREVAVRLALGASHGEVARLFLTESTLLALGGGIVGLALAGVGVRLLVQLRPPGIPRLEQVGIGGAVLAFTLLVVLTSGLLAGALAVVRSLRLDLVPTLKEGGRSGTGSQAAHRSRRTLAAIQIALALVLLVGATLMIKSFRRLQAVDPGLDPDGVLTASLTLPRAQYPDAQAIARFVRDLRERVEAVPGVRSAAMVSQLPLDGGSSGSNYAIEDHPMPSDAALPLLNNQFVSPGYFETLKIPVLAGTPFTRLDPDRRQGEVVVSRSVAERFWPGQSPLGKRLTPETPREGEWYTIVGVVGNVRELGLQQEPTQVVYFGWRRLANPNGEEHWVPPGGTLVVRTEGDPAAFAGRVREAVHAVDPSLPVTDVRTMKAVVTRSTARAAFTMLLLGIAAAIALLLGGIGIYGVIAYIVSQRTREIGVRMALGARRSEIARLVLRDGLILALAGVGVGLLAAFLLARYIGGLLYKVSPTDPMTFVGVPVFLSLVTLVASWLPARRAAAVEPSEAIRTE
jgi:putative ABC transport system permease protein